MNIRKGASVGPRPDATHARDAVSWMTESGIEDCRITVANATLDELVRAHDWCRENPGNNKTRAAVIRGAMRRRFRVRAASEISTGKAPQP